MEESAASGSTRVGAERERIAPVDEISANPADELTLGGGVYQTSACLSQPEKIAEVLRDLKSSGIARDWSDGKERRWVEFAGRHLEYTGKHQDEVVPAERTPAKVGIIYKAYRELSNGNLAEQLLALSKLSASVNDFEAAFVVNNTRFIAVLGEVMAGRMELLQGGDLTAEVATQMRQLILSYYRDRNWEPTEDEQRRISQIGDIETVRMRQDAPYFNRLVRDYQENQATVQILQTITQAVNASAQVDNPTEQETQSQPVLAEIRKLAAPFLSEEQVRVLEAAAKQALRKRLRIIAVDCSSPCKAFERANLGKAVNEGMHLLYARGVFYFSPMDMDEFIPPGGLREIIKLTSQDPAPALLIRPLEIVTFQHPEQMGNERIWGSLMEYYHHAYMSKHFPGLVEPDYEQLLAPVCTGQLLCDRKQFVKSEYPELELDEDSSFADEVLQIPGSQKYYLADPESALRLSDRKRENSFGGRFFNGAYDTVERLQFKFMSDRQRAAKDLIVLNNLIEGWLRSVQIVDHEGKPANEQILSYYRKIRGEAFRRNQRRLEIARRLFFTNREGLAQPGIVPRLWQSWQSNKQANPDLIIANAKLTDRQSAFLKQNPLLVAGLLKELQLRSFSTLPQILGFIEKTLPEIFAKPVSREPAYDLPHLLPDEANKPIWMQVHQAHLLLFSHLSNLHHSGQLVLTGPVPGYERNDSDPTFFYLPEAFEESGGG